jgi:hypothetical protein
MKKVLKAKPPYEKYFFLVAGESDTACDIIVEVRQQYDSREIGDLRLFIT